VWGQGANTCVCNAISGVQAWIDSAAEEYRNSHDALQLLAPNLIEFQWKEELLLLMPEDIRDLLEGKAGVSEGKRTISWIWRTVTKSSNESSNKSLLNHEMLI
jgi:DNA polymerase III delta prime subunit